MHHNAKTIRAFIGRLPRLRFVGGGGRARDNSIVAWFRRRFASIELLHGIKTNVPSIALLKEREAIACEAGDS
jgi:hypothetical protein